MQIHLFLNNVRSAHNVGAIFRTADGAGVAQIYLGGYTPSPLDRFGRVQPAIAKTSLGAAETVPWQTVTPGGEVAVLKRCRQAGYAVVALEQHPTSTSIYDFTVPERVVYVVGNEVDGVQSDILALADTIVSIPMHGYKESLNVATATGILLYTR